MKSTDIKRHSILDPSADHTLFRQQDEAVNRIIRHIDDFPDVPGSDQTEQFVVNHVISLLGNRGSGKTTALMQVRKRLEHKDYNELIATRLLVSDVLHSPDAIGPAIIRLLQQAFESRSRGNPEAADKVQEIFEGFGDNLAWFSNALVPNDIVARDSISSRQYSRKMFAYHQSALDLPANFSRQLENCMEMLGVKRVLVFIDDADINIDLVEKVLDFIRYFLSSPKIVTVFAADHETLRRRLFNKRLAQLHLEKLPDSEGFSLFGQSSKSFKSREIEAEREYIDAFLLKLLPPATRVYLPVMSGAELLEHEISLPREDGIKITSSETFGQVHLLSSHSDQQVAFVDLVRRYPDVLEKNLRGFVNQFSEISDIVQNYRQKNRAYFGLQGKEVEVNLDGGILGLTASLSDLDEAVVIHILRVLLSSPVHANWLEAWSYYGILDAKNETSLQNLLDAVVSRTQTLGSAIDNVMYQLTGMDGESIRMKRKEETHILSLIIDLAILWGADFREICRYIGHEFSGLRRYLSLSDNHLKFLEGKGREIAKNMVILHGSDQSSIAGLVLPMHSPNSAEPFFVRNMRELALHSHRALPGKEKLDSVLRKDKALVDVFLDEKADDDSILQAEVTQLYNVLYYGVSICLDELSSIYCNLNDVSPAIFAPKSLSYTTNRQALWGIIRPVKGWSFLLETLSNKNGGYGPAQFDRALQILMRFSQMAYEVTFSCFSGEHNEVNARDDVLICIKAFREDLEDRGFVTNGRMANDIEFRAALELQVDMIHLQENASVWKTFDFGESLQSLLPFLEFVENADDYLPPGFDLRSNPPQAWKVWVEEFEKSIPAKTPKKDKKRK